MLDLYISSLFSNIEQDYIDCMFYLIAVNSKIHYKVLAVKVTAGGFGMNIASQ